MNLIISFSLNLHPSHHKARLHAASWSGVRLLWHHSQKLFVFVSMRFLHLFISQSYEDVLIVSLTPTCHEDVMRLWDQLCVSWDVQVLLPATRGQCGAVGPELRDRTFLQFVFSHLFSLHTHFRKQPANRSHVYLHLSCCLFRFYFNKTCAAE